jgi:mono/diheme cytochrome c family protein
MRKPWMTMIALGALGACVETEMPAPDEGRALFMQHCAACHGPGAQGDGPLAAELGLMPADLTRIAQRNGGALPRAQVMSTIDGYARSDAPDGMPEFGVLLEGDLVPFDSGDGMQTPTPRKLVALLEYLESIQETD